MKKLKLLAATSLALTISCAGYAGNDKPNVNVDAKTKADATAVTNRQLASQLIQTMDADNRDPLLLTTAAYLLRSAEKSTIALETKKESEGGTDDEGTKSGTTYTSESLFAEARALAGQDANLIAVIEDAESQGSRGAVGGAKSAEEVVRARSNDWYSIEFRGDRKAQVLVVGDGDTDLDLYVYDENDGLICDDTDTTDTMYCEWTPAWTGEFKIRIKNLGNVRNYYEIMTN